MIDEKLMNVLYKYGLEPIYNFVNFGRLESKTTSHVASMYFIPDTIHLLTGRGFERWPTNGYPLPDPRLYEITYIYWDIWSNYILWLSAYHLL